MKRDKKFAVVEGTAAKEINQEEVDTMEVMSAAQTEDVMAPETETAATPQVAEANQPEKVGFFTKVKNGVQNTGKKIWDNRGKLGVAVGVIGTFATAAALNRWKNEAEHMNNMLEEETGDGESETSETTENTEES